MSSPSKGRRPFDALSVAHATEFGLSVSIQSTDTSGVFGFVYDHQSGPRIIAIQESALAASHGLTSRHGLIVSIHSGHCWPENLSQYNFHRLNYMESQSREP